MFNLSIVLNLHRFYPIFFFVYSDVNASSLSSEEDIELDFKTELTPEIYGIIGKLQCKLCKEAMKLVEKEVNKDSSKVKLYWNFDGILNESHN